MKIKFFSLSNRVSRRAVRGLPGCLTSEPVTYRLAGEAANGGCPVERNALKDQRMVYLDGKTYVQRGNNIVRVR